MIRITVQVPKEILNVDAIRDEIEDAVELAARDIHEMFVESVSTWDEKVVFLKKDIRSNNAIGVEIYTTNDVYSYVNYGTKPHIIRPGNKGMLRFQTGYRPKSKVGSRKSFAGGKYGDWTGAFFVRHPGSEARQFDELIGKDYQPDFEKNVQDAIDRGAR